MKKQTNWLVVLILILGMAGLACNAILGNDNQAEPTAPSAVTVEVATVPANEAGGETGGATTSSAAPTLNLNPENNFGVPSSVTSYRFNLDVQYEETAEDGTVNDGHITAAGAQVLNPFASMMDFTFEGGPDDLGLAGSGISITQIEDQTYLVTPGVGCITTGDNSAFDASMMDFSNTGDFLGGLQGATLVEENVTINGVQTNHYRFDDSALDQADQQSFGTLQNVEGHIYISSADGYLIRMTVEADGTDLSLGGLDQGTADATTSGHIIYQIDYSDYNTQIDITEPEGCNGGGDSEFPMLADAANVSTFGDIVNYSTESSFEDIVNFYKTEMVAAGYTLSSDFSSPPTAILTFDKDGQEVTVTVSENTGGSGFLVTIIKG